MSFQTSQLAFGLKPFGGCWQLHSVSCRGRAKDKLKAERETQVDAKSKSNGSGRMINAYFSENNIFYNKADFLFSSLIKQIKCMMSCRWHEITVTVHTRTIVNRLCFGQYNRGSRKVFIRVYLRALALWSKFTGIKRSKRRISSHISRWLTNPYMSIIQPCNVASYTHTWKTFDNTVISIILMMPSIYLNSAICKDVTVKHEITVIN